MSCVDRHCEERVRSAALNPRSNLIASRGRWIASRRSRNDGRLYRYTAANASRTSFIGAMSRT